MATIHLGHSLDAIGWPHRSTRGSPWIT